MIFYTYTGPANLGIALQSHLVSSHLKRARERRPLVAGPVSAKKQLYTTVKVQEVF